MSEYLKALKADTPFRDAMKKVRERSRPIVPKYTVCETVEQRESLIENIKIKTGEQAGFDMLYQLLTGESPT
jgi:hypothetical protein